MVFDESYDRHGRHQNAGCREVMLYEPRPSKGYTDSQEVPPVELAVSGLTGYLRNCEWIEYGHTAGGVLFYFTR